MKLRDVMASPVEPVWIGEFAHSAARWMADHRLTAAPVFDDGGRLVGLVTASHLELAWLEDELRPLRGGRFPPICRRRTATVGDVMSSPVASLTPGADISQARQVFDDRKVDCLLVVDGHSVVGSVSRRDFLQGFRIEH